MRNDKIHPIRFSQRRLVCVRHKHYTRMIYTFINLRRKHVHIHTYIRIRLWSAGNLTVNEYISLKRRRHRVIGEWANRHVLTFSILPCNARIITILYNTAYLAAPGKRNGTVNARIDSRKIKFPA